jgi:hypothetical protein
MLIISTAASVNSIFFIFIIYQLMRHLLIWFSFIACGCLLHHCEFGEAEHKDFCASIFEMDGGFGIEACSLNGLYYPPAKTFVKDSGTDLDSPTPFRGRSC